MHALWYNLTTLKISLMILYFEANVAAAEEAFAATPSTTRLLKEADLSVGEYIGIAVACAVPFLILLFICLFCIKEGYTSCFSRRNDDIANLPVAQAATISTPYTGSNDELAKATV